MEERGDPFPAIVLVSLLLYLTGLFGDSYWGLIENRQYEVSVCAYGRKGRRMYGDHEKG